MTTAAGSGFRKLTRDDLTTFDREAKDLILDAMSVGCLGRISGKGHAILRNNTGGTTSVPRNLTSQNRTAQNARADMRRLLAQHRREVPDAEQPLRAPTGPRQITVARAFTQYGSEFVRWLDEQGGLPADALIDVEIPDSGTPQFRVVSVPAVTVAAPTPNQKSIPRTEITVSTAKPDKTKPTIPDSSEGAEATLKRIRDVLGVDPEVVQLRARIAELEEQLSDEKTRADAAETRLELIQQAFNA